MYTSTLNGRSQRQRRRNRTRFSLFCEQLEGRQLLSTGTLPMTLGPIDLTYGQTLDQVVNGGIAPAEVNINGNDVPGTWTFASASDPTQDLTMAVLDAGSHTTDLTATFHPSDSADWGDNYSAASVDVEIAKAKIAIVADSDQKTYGDANPTLTDTLYADLGTEIDPTTGQPEEVFKPLGPTDLAPVAYAGALGGAAAASTDADQLSHVGSYDINPTQISDAGAGTASHEFLNNFDVTYTNGSVTITPAALTITANDATKTYGDTVAFGGVEFSTAGLVNGDSIAGAALASDGAAATAHVSGSPYDITVGDADAGDGTELTDYDITYVDGTLTVTPATLFVLVNDATKTYGDALAFSGTEFETVGLLNSDTIASVPLSSDGAAAMAHVSGSPYLITAGGAVAGDGTELTDYDISYLDGSLTVTPAALTITANDATKTYGDAVAFSGSEFSTVGLVNGDSIAGAALASDGAAATAHVSGSPYLITVGGAVAGDGTELTDYTITYVDGSLTVTPAALTITANDATKTYGVVLAFSGVEFSANGLVNGDTIASVSLASDGATATAHVIGSPYDITSGGAVAGAGTELSDYAISYVNGSLTVTPAALTITASDAAKTYGNTVAFSGSEFSASGLVNGDSIAGVSLASGGAAATAHVIGSPYAITAGGAVAGDGTELTDYTISYRPGNLTVTPRALTITANGATKTYGDTVGFSGTEFSTVGLVNGDTIAGVSLASGGAAATANVIGSPYAITAGGAVAGDGTELSDYAISYQSGNLTVTPRVLIVTANNATMVLGGPLPTFSAYYVGFVNGDNPSELGGSLRFTPGDTSHAGTTTISLGGTLTDSDYTIEYKPGTLTVTVPTKPIIIGLPPSKPKP